METISHKSVEVSTRPKLSRCCVVPVTTSPWSYHGAVKLLCAPGTIRPLCCVVPVTTSPWSYHGAVKLLCAPGTIRPLCCVVPVTTSPWSYHGAVKLLCAPGTIRPLCCVVPVTTSPWSYHGAVKLLCAPGTIRPFCYGPWYHQFLEPLCYLVLPCPRAAMAPPAATRSWCCVPLVPPVPGDSMVLCAPGTTSPWGFHGAVCP